ncbi:TetR/AcrR family transcriptional regulator [Dyadobacter sp. 3J3]|uniref:TetR/AcrR family transcriptional regulator n=1 Tax=Dyadobacter sp. 3J3 TaxID=2606600 RepID=UPI0013596D99|nr:TetR/AcrR family transcriptional regulator [Dyadobacter sp. 3J3]
MRRQQIINAACVLFNQMGTQAVSTQDIASACGISKKTLYQLFESKDLLIEAVVESLIDKSGQLLGTALKEQEPLTQMLNLLKSAQQIAQLFSTPFFHGLKKYYHNAFRLLSHFIQTEFLSKMMEVIQSGKNQNVFVRSMDSRMLVNLYCWQMQNAISDKSLPQENREQIFRYIGHFFLLGILKDRSIIITEPEMSSQI